MRRALILFGVLLTAPVWAADPVATPAAKFDGWQGPKPTKPPCQCRARDGNKVDLGAKTCVKRGDSLVTLQCRLVLNNTAWQQIQDGCDVAMN